MRTERSIFMHLPKTAGMWVNNVCQSIGVNTDGMPFYFKDVDHRIKIDTQGKRVFSFVRNPWTWYVSLYQHQLRRGAVAGYPDYTNKELDFVSFLYICMEMPLWMRVKAWQRYTDMQEQILSDINNEKQNRSSGSYNPITYEPDIHDEWVKNNSVLDLCSFMIKQYTKNADQIGRTESIADDLTAMLVSTNELSAEIEQRISATPVVNAGNITDYRSFYTNETYDLVADHCAEVITRFNYDF